MNIANQTSSSHSHSWIKTRVANFSNSSGTWGFVRKTMHINLDHNSNTFHLHRILLLKRWGSTSKQCYFLCKRSLLIHCFYSSPLSDTKPVIRLFAFKTNSTDLFSSQLPFFFSNSFLSVLNICCNIIATTNLMQWIRNWRYL